MKKPYSFDIKSDKKCAECSKPLKLRIVNSKPTARLCYSCWREDQAGHGHKMKAS